MILTLKPKFQKHSEHLGYVIYKRLPNTGSSGGFWMVQATMFKTLASAKSYAKFLADANTMPIV